MNKPSELILTAGPSITDLEKKYCADAVENGWNQQWNKYINKFENSFKEYLSCKHAISTSSCTGGLHLSLLALGIGPGDEVLVPEITWVATASTVAYVGAKPVFVDVDPNTWTLDPSKLEEKRTKNTKAIMPVHLYGHPAHMKPIMDFAQTHNLKVVEDAAPALGAESDNQKTGTFGDAAVFSFQGAKLMVTGEGGMVVTNNDDIAARVQKLNNHGRSATSTRPFWIDEVGYKYKMSNVQAALGLAQLERANELIDKKRQIFGWYQDRLAEVPGIQLNQESSWGKSIYWMSSLYLKKDFSISRDDLMKKLKEDNIDSRAVFPAISQYPMWKEGRPSPIAHHIGENSLNLPSGHNLVEEQIDYICERIVTHLK